MKIIHVHYVYLTLYLCVSGCRYGFFLFYLIQVIADKRHQRFPSIFFIHAAGRVMSLDACGTRPERNNTHTTNE
jgi:hypothetical protein